MIPASFIQDLLTRVDIVELVGRHVELRRAGINHKGLCPFHGEKTPSFIVSPSRQTYHCFGCGVHGDAVRFLTEFVGLGFVEAVTELAQQVGLPVPQDERSPQERQAQADRRKVEADLSGLLDQVAGHYYEQLRQSQRAIEYLRGRGVSGEIAKRFRIGYAPEGWRFLSTVLPTYDDPRLEEAGLVIRQEGEGAPERRYDRFRDRIMFPIRSVRGDVIGFGGRVLDGGEPKYLNSPETPVFIKGRELYGLFEARTAIRKAGHVLVVEGYMDVVALAQLGLGHAVATLGTACTEDHVRKLFRFTDSVVFSFDGDAAGRKAAARALEAALPHAGDTRSIRFLFLPPEHDPDSYIREHGAQAFSDEVDRSTPLSRQMLNQASAGCDLQTPEGRARFTSQVQPLWSALPDGALKRQVLAEVARLAALSPVDLVAVWGLGTRSAPRGEQLSPATSPFGSDGAGSGLPPGGGRAADRPGGTGRMGFGKGNPRWDDPLRRGAARPSSRVAPRRPIDLVVHLLLTHPAWWMELAPDDLDLLRELGEPHATLLSWLERDVEEHGPRPWAVVQRALSEDADAAQAWQRLPAHADVEHEGNPGMLRRALDLLLLDALQRRQTVLAQQASQDPQAQLAYRDVFARWKALKQALESGPADPSAGG